MYSNLFLFLYRQHNLTFMVGLICKNFLLFWEKALLAKHLILNNRNIFDQKTIANSFNEYFVYDGPKLACKIPLSQR